MFLAIKTTAEYTCGNLSFNFSGMIPYVISMVVTIIKIAVPVVLIIFGMIDFLKAVTASKEDEIKKGQQTFIKRLIAAVIVFFVVQIVQLVASFASNNDANVTGCFNCFINGDNCKLAKATKSNGSGI